MRFPPMLPGCQIVVVTIPKCSLKLPAKWGCCSQLQGRLPGYTLVEPNPLCFRKQISMK